MPATFVATSAAIVINRLLSDPFDSAIGIVAIGLPVYWLWGHRGAALANAIGQAATVPRPLE